MIMTLLVSSISTFKNKFIDILVNQKDDFSRLQKSQINLLIFIKT